MSQPITPTDRTNTPPALADLERETWRQLALVPTQKQDTSAGNSSGNGPFKTMTLATCTANGADARMVVLRQVNTDQKYLWFHTDARSDKVLELEAFPNATLLFWDDRQQVQLRLTIETRLHTDDHIADRHWENLWVGGRKMYLSEQRPGSEQPGPYPGFPAHLGDNVPAAEETEAGRPNFAVIECRVLKMDYLHLSRSGQSRARFQYEPVEKWTWLAP